MKIYRVIFLIIRIVIFPLICLQSGYADNVTSNNIQETVIKITTPSYIGFSYKTPSSNNQNAIKYNNELLTFYEPNKESCVEVENNYIIFNKPSEQKITIKNYTQYDIVIDSNMLFIGDEFTAPIIAHGITIKGGAGCSVIKAGTSCSFLLSAKKNASPSINPDGEVLLLNYELLGYTGKQNGNFAKLKVKINYNDGIKFKVRNLDFSSLEQKPMERGFLGAEGGQCIAEKYLSGLDKDNYSLPLTQKLVIINNYWETIKVTQVKAIGQKQDLVFGSFANCTNLHSGESCVVDVTLINPMATTDIPIHVTYDTPDRKGLVAVAAAIVPKQKYSNKDSNAKITRAVISGTTTAATIFAAYSMAVRNILVTIIPFDYLPTRVAKIAVDGAVGFNAGIAFSAVDGLVGALFDEDSYSSSKISNKLLEFGTMHFLLATVSCSGVRYSTLGDYSYPICVIGSIGCGMLGSLGSHFSNQVLYPNVPLRLPEQNSQTQETISFNLAALLRIGSKFILGLPNDGLTEIYQDTLSGYAMDKKIGDISRYFTEKNFFYIDIDNRTSSSTIIENKFDEDQICNSRACSCFKL